MDNRFIKKLLLSISFLILFTFNIKAVDSNYFSIDLKTTTPTISSGSDLRFSLDYSFSNLTSTYKDAYLEVEIPSSLTSAGATISAANMPIAYTTGETATLVGVVTGNKIRYTIPANKLVEPGFASSIDLILITTARYTTLPADYDFKATIGGTVDNVLQTLSDTQVNKINVVKDWLVNKTAQFSYYNKGKYVRYRLFINGPNHLGSLAAKSFVVKDTLPAGLTFVGFDDPNDPIMPTVHDGFIQSDTTTYGGAKTQPYSNIPGSYPAGTKSHNNNEITWTIPSSSAVYNNNSYMELTFWAKINDDVNPTADNPVSITNTAKLVTTYIDDSTSLDDGPTKISVIDDTGVSNNDPQKALYFINGGYGLDTSSIYYKISANTFKNESTAELLNYTISDNNIDYSNSMTLKNILIPSMRYNGDGGVLTYTLYFYNGASIIETQANKTTLNSRTYQAPLNATGYKIVFNKIPRTESGSSLSDIIIGFGFDSTKLEEQKCVFNRVNIEYNANDVTNRITKSSGCDPIVDEGAARVTLSKSIINKKNIYQYEDTINFNISYSNSLYSGKNVKGAYFYDLLPKGLRYIPNSTVGNTVEFVETIDNYKNTGNQAIVWKAKTDIAPNASANFSFNCFVNEEIILGTSTNTIYMLADTKLDNDFNYSNYPKDTTDVDQDNNTTESAIFMSTSFNTVPYTGIIVSKEVKGDQDTDWTKYPDYGVVSAAGQFSYRIKIKNASLQPIKEVNILDILPRINDTGVLVGTARDTEWTPSLKAAIPNANGFVIEYSESTNPNRGIIGRPAIGEATTIWSNIAFSDITRAKSLKISYPGTIGSGEEKTITFNMVSPVGAPRNGEIAWNSLAMQAKNNLNALTTPTEPKKVGILTKPPLNNSISGFTWLDTNRDGIKDPSETGLNGVKVYLLDKNLDRLLDTDNNPIYTVTANNNTNSPGFYTFVGYDNGEYAVEFEQLNNYGLSPQPEDNPLNTNKSDYNLTSRKTSKFLVNADVNNIDGGFTLNSLGDFIFNDVNENGIQDNGEVGLEGVKVELLKDDVVIKTVTTGSDGKYLFDNLESGDYKINITKPLQYVFSPSNATNDSNDSDFDPISLQVASSNVTLSLQANNIGQDNLDSDGGLYLGQGKISGLAWDDLKRDNVYGDKPTSGLEEFVSGVVFELYNSENVLVLTKTTSTNGQYLFDNLPDDKYTIKVTYPNNYTIVLKDAGNDETIDSDFNQTTNISDEINLENQEEITDIDAGLRTQAQGSISGMAYLDDNYDCIYQPGASENIYAGLRVDLVEDNIVLATTTTNQLGEYTFTGLFSGSYVVKFYENDALIYIGNAYATTNLNESTLNENVSVVSNNDVVTNIPTGGVCIRYKEASIGDYIWYDENRNGLQDLNESGFKDAVVSLYEDGTLVTSVNSDANGYYFFSNLQVDSEYKVSVKLNNTDYTFTTPFVNDGTGTNTKNSIFTVDNTDSSLAYSDPYTLAANTSNTQFDAGVVYKASSIGDLIFFDENQDGIQDQTSGTLEKPIAGIKVNLYKKENNAFVYVTSKTTGSNGKYLFDNLNPNEYKVEIDEASLPAFLSLTSQASTTNDLDSDFNRTTFSTNVTLQANETNNNIDGGLITKATSIGDYLWIDLDRDGMQDASDQPLTNTNLTLYKVINNVKTAVRTTTTDSLGKYEFELISPFNYDGTNFIPNEYYVGFDVPAGMLLSTNSGGTYENVFSLQSGLNLSQAIQLSTTSYVNKISTIDGAVEYVPSSIEGNVWLDQSRDGIFDSTEQLLNGFKIELYYKDGNTWTFLKDLTPTINGYYNFDNLNPNEYKLKIVNNQASLYALTSYQSTTLDSDNDYCPTVQDPDDYKGLETVSCPNPDETASISLGYNQRIQDIDAGLQVKYSSIGDYTWHDFNRNGLQDSGENAIGNISVTLLDKNKQFIKTMVSDNNGYYKFKRLEADDYYLEATITNAYQFTTSGASDETRNSNIDALTRQSNLITLNQGVNNNDLDIGLVNKPSSLGDYIWFDKNENGIQDTNENGLANISVSLRNTDGTPALDMNGTQVSDIVTLSDGKYLFENLNPQTYKIVLDLSAADKLLYKPTLLNQQGILSDSNLDDDFEIKNIVLSSNENNLNMDAGMYYRKASVAGLTWIDSDEDGLNDNNETIIDKINVKLYIKDLNTNDYTLLTTMLSKSDGSYLFDNLEARRTYKIKIEKPLNYDYTLTKQGSDQDIDSDVSQTDGYTLPFILGSGENLKHIDSGYTNALGIIGDYVWIDDNRNGLQDVAEPGLNKVVVKLLDSNNAVLKTTFTNSSGYYRFDNLGADTYRIKVDLPSNFKSFTRKVTSDSLKDNNVDLNGYSDLINLASKQHDLSVDAGLIDKNALIGDYVWYDKNHNGIQDKNEKGLNKVKVTLTNKQTNTKTVTYTNSQGKYLFDALKYGTYCVKVDLINNYVFTKDNIGSATKNNKFSKAKPEYCTTLVSAQENRNVDAGLISIKDIERYGYDTTIIRYLSLFIIACGLVYSQRKRLV